MAKNNAYCYFAIMTSEEFWKTSGTQSIIPQGFGQFPEGFDVREEIRSMVEKVDYSSVIDFGCGYGRLCESFSSNKYLGVDINEEALLIARQKYEQYQFSLSNKDPKYADLYLAYTVFLHFTDKELNETLKNIKCKWLIVAEVLGKEWRRDGLPPVYNRDLSDYIKILRSHDFVLEKHVKKPYKRYAESSWYEGKNTNVSFLLFRKYLKGG